MHLTPREEERLLIASAADLARRRIDRGSRLGSTEAIALVSDTVLEAAWDGATLEEAQEAGRAAVPRSALLDGVADLVPEIQVEALFEFGSTLVSIKAPFGPRSDEGPGAVTPGRAERLLAPERRRATCLIENTGAAHVWISSHAPLDQLNDALIFSGLPEGRWRIDSPAGISQRIAAGESKKIAVVEILGGSTS